MKLRALTLRMSLGLTVALGAGLLSPSPVWAGPPPMANPSAMSGIPRPDPKLSPGTVTVRCLGKAGFSAPAVDLEVELVITGTDGQTTRLTAKTQEQGRATFDGLSDHIGGSAVAKATLGGAEVSSSSISLLPQAGTAVMLVEGAGTPASSPPPQAQPRPNTPDIPAPGNAFALQGTELGTLTIGTFDLDARKPIGSVVVKLTITPPEGDPIVRELTTDARGKAIFDKLLPPDTPAGSKMVAEATLVDGGTLRKSAAFEMDPTQGMALVLAEGADNFNAAPRQQPPPQAGPRALPGPRIIRTLDPGKVRIKLWSGADQPIAGQKVIVVKKTAAGGVDKYRAETGADGTVVVENVPVQQDALYFVESIFSRAPYQSSFFGMDSRGGVAVDLRLFETTADRSVVRSAVQYDVEERENDLAQIVQIYEVMVSGDKAFWDPKLEISSVEGAKGFVVLRPAEAFLDHAEKAPFATLHGPIPPGQTTNLSVGYLLEQTGEVHLQWDPPFEVIQSSVLVSDSLTLVAEQSEATDLPSPIPTKVVHTMSGVPQGELVDFTMLGLRHRSPLIKRIGWFGLAGFGLVTLVGLMRRRPGRRTLLIADRDRLLEEVAAAGQDETRLEQLLSELDRVVRQLEVLDSADGTSPKPSAEG